MDLKNEKPAVEILFMAYNVVLGGIWVLRAAEQSVTPLMVFLHVVLAFLFMEMPRLRTDTGVLWKILRRLYPFVLWSLAWSEIGWLYNLTSPMVFDPAVKALDLALFGIHLNQVLAGVLDWQLLRNVMGFSYLSYYLLILGPPLLLGLKGRLRDLEFHTFGLLSTYVVCFLIYLVMPVLGPRDLALAAGETAVGVGGLFGPLINAFFEAGDSLGTAFPSSHCAGSVASALLVRRHFGRAGRLALVWAGFIVVSTVYTNNHYAIDAVAGVATAMLTVKLAAALSSGHPVKPSRKILGMGAGSLNLPGRQESGTKGGLS